MLAETETANIVSLARLGVGEEYLRRGLLDDRGANPALERVAGVLSAEADDAIALANGFFPVAHTANEYVIIKRLPAFIDDDDRRRAVELLLDAMEQIHHRRCTGDRRVEDPGHVEPEHVMIEVKAILGIVEQPGMFSIITPGTQPGRHVAGARAPGADEQLTQISQATMVGRLAEVGVDRVDDDRAIFSVEQFTACRQDSGKPVGEKCAIGRGIVHLQRI